MARLLLVEDDDRIAAPLLRALTREGYDVDRFDAGGPALQRARQGDLDLVLLDLGLPDMDGLDVCRRLREDGFTAGILILTARDEELDRVVGLDSGADDYMAKPFALAELLARTRALLRRSAIAVAAPSAASDSPSDRTVAGPAKPGLRIDRGTRRVLVGEAELPLTAKEFELLLLLEREQGAVVTRDRAITEVWDANWFGSTKMLDSTLGRLRAKLEEAGAPVRITTVRGVGFRIDRADDA